MLKVPPAARTDACGVSDAKSSWTLAARCDCCVESARDDRGTRPYHRLRRSAHGSGECPTIAWYRVTCGMLKLPPAARTDACGVSDAKSTERLAARRIGSSRIPETEIARLGRGLVPNQARQSKI